MRVKKKTVYITIILFIIAILFLAGRGPYISNALKKLILPELELMTGKKIIAGKIYINVFPLFVEMKDAIVFNENGAKLLSAERVKGYVTLTGLIRKELIINRLVIRNSEVRVGKDELKEVFENVRKYLAIERKDTLKVAIRSVVLDNSFLDLHDGEKRISIRSVYSEATLADKPAFNLSLRELNLHMPGIPEMSGSVDAIFSVDKDMVDIRSLKVGAYGSQIKSSGTIGIRPVAGKIKTDIDLLMKSVKKVFALSKSGEGKINASGTIKAKNFTSLGSFNLDLKINGDLYLETLMELLKVKEKLEGHVEVNGTLTGPFNDLRGAIAANMNDGNLFGVKIDRLKCAINYQDKVMRFTDARASLYGGSATAEAMINLPVVDYYRFKVFAKQVESKGLFELIKWDPGIAPGKVDGEISSEGSSFSPQGNFSYRKSAGGKDVLERVHVIDGTFSMVNNVITLPRLSISTGSSSVSATGSVDLPKNVLFFRANGVTKDLNDLTAPYFTALSGPAAFGAVLSGAGGDPVLDLKFKSSDTKFFAGKLDLPNLTRPHTVSFSTIDGDVTYKKDLLIVKNFRAVSPGMTVGTLGQIHFQKAKHLFDVISPVYDLRISFDNGDLKDLSAMLQGAPPLLGSFRSSFSFIGPGELARASGDYHARDIVMPGDYSLDNADAVLAFEKGEFTFKSLTIKKGPVLLNAKGMVSINKKYDLSATMKSLDLMAVLPHNMQEKLKDSNLRLISLSDVAINGHGTFAEPYLKLNGVLRYRDPGREQSSGSGMVTAELIGKNATLTVNFMDGKMKIQGASLLTETMPWHVDIKMLSARSDFLLAGFLKDVPEDLLINLKGDARLWGDRNSFNGILSLEKAYVYGYGYGLTNSKPISVKLQDRVLSVESFAMKSETAEVRLKGEVHIGKSFNLSLDGASSLAPLRSASRNIDVLKGDANFALTLTGAWDKPRINGKMSVANGAFGLKNISHRLTSVSANIYADEDRIVVEEARGKISGGDIVLHGTVYLDRFSLKRFFFESKLTNVTVSVSRNFWAHFDGNLAYQGSLQAQNITGDLELKKARYTERVEWKSWLLQAGRKERMKIEAGKLDQTGLNVRVRGSNLSIDNNVARAAIKMDLVVRGTMGQPALLGRIETINGIVYFRNNEFSLLKGVVDFANPNEISPYFDILAESRIKNYTVRLSLDGHIDQFNFALSASPALEESDILSLLTVGDVGKNLKGLEGGIGAAEATSFLTGKMQDVAEDRLKTITGVDRLQIDPSVSRTAGTVSPRVTLSKKLIGERLYATYSASADVKEGQIIKLEYLLSKNSSLVGVRDAQGGIGADIKFRFEFK